MDLWISILDDPETMASITSEGTSRDQAESGDKAITQDASTVLQPSPSEYEKSRPMKHLTCFFWFHYKCKYSEPNCLYAHWETGHIASAPCQVEPGKLDHFLGIT